MNWYLLVKFLHILAVTITIGGMFSRQLVRGLARRSEDIQSVASLTHAALRIDRILIIPWSTLILPFGIVLAVMSNWPAFGFLQGASQNWLLVSNILLVFMLALIPVVFIPHNKKVEPLLDAAVAQGSITPELRLALGDGRNEMAHYAQEALVLLITALMVLKPF